MAPKRKSVVEHVDGVHCSYNLASWMVAVGTGLVGNRERDNFKLSGECSTAALEEQDRKRPMFQHFRLLAGAQISEQPEAELQQSEPHLAVGARKAGHR